MLLELSRRINPFPLLAHNCDFNALYLAGSKHSRVCSDSFLVVFTYADLKFLVWLRSIATDTFMLGLWEKYINTSWRRRIS